MKLESYVNGSWQAGAGNGTLLVNPVTGAEIARADCTGVDLAAGLDFARREGGAALRVLTYGERAAMLRAISDVLAAKRDDYDAIARENSGNTRGDAAMDIDGGIGTLKYYAGLGKQLGDARYLMEPGDARLGKDESLQAAHLLAPIAGTAIHINAYNFPSWGLWEKAAVALLSGVAVFAKPATATALLAQRMVRDVVTADVLPRGALSILCGAAPDLLNHVRPHDAVAFTGSAETAARLRANPAVIESNCRFNVEADSLNVAILGPDATPGTAEFDLFVKEVARELTVKAGQKCTAIRRALVPFAQLDAVVDALCDRLARLQPGDPADEAVHLGPLVSRAQRDAALDALARLRTEAEVVLGADGSDSADGDSGAYFPPTLLRCKRPHEAEAVHDVEAFAPVATVMPYRDMADAAALAARGDGALVASVFTADDAFAGEAILALAPYHGRVLVIDESVAQASPGHGVVMPQCVHGGPGRAGGGEELGGLRGLRFYHQRTAVQASLSRLARLRTAAAEVTL